jgi:hypothetical protein
VYWEGLTKEQVMLTVVITDDFFFAIAYLNKPIIKIMIFKKVS